MDATADYPSSPYLSNVDASESAPSTPKPNLSDPRSPRLSNAANFYNSSDVVCISSGAEPSPPKKKLTDFFKTANTRTPAFLNALRQYELELVGYAKTHTDAEAARHFSIPRTTLRAWKGLEL